MSCDLEIEENLFNGKILGKRNNDMSTQRKPSSKRQRVVTPEQYKNLEPVAQKVITWLADNLNQLPSTEEHLMMIINSISCNVKVDENIVFYHLLLNGLVEFKPDSDLFQINTEFDVNKPLQGFVLGNTDPTTILSPDFCLALENAARWVLSSKEIPSTKSEICEALRPICVIRRDVPSKAVLEMLYNREFLERHGTAELRFYLPSLPRQHYSSVL